MYILGSSRFTYVFEWFWPSGFLQVSVKYLWSSALTYMEMPKTPLDEKVLLIGGVMYPELPSGPEKRIEKLLVFTG